MKFIIYASSYDENVGGFIVLHQLCHELNKMGEEAYLWPKDEPPLNWENPLRSIYRLIKYNYILNNQYNTNYQIRKDWNTPIAGFLDLNDAIVIYPEVISGNPLNAKKVVRWFLNKPGRLSGAIDYGKDELYFYYAEAFNDEKINPDLDNKLRLVTIMDNIYKQTNFGERSGTCYMMRKGKGRKIVHDLDDSVLIDGMSHEETAEVFNRTKYLISYDLYSMYLSYAVMCGCIPIVVPDPNVSEEEWRASHGKEKYGIAYGFDKEQIEYAKNTQHKVLEEFQKIKVEQKHMLKHFIEKCRNRFY